jgi:hypothetical protein
MHLHICTVKDDAAENALMTSQNQWEGRLKAVKNEIAGMERKMESKLAVIKANQAKIEAQLSAILQALQNTSK